LVNKVKVGEKMHVGHTLGMKVAVSIPDELFAEAESLAQRFVGHHAPERVTEQMNQVVGAVGEGEPDVFRAEAARRVFKRTAW
jgi:hypothetical protein